MLAVNGQMGEGLVLFIHTLFSKFGIWDDDVVAIIIINLGIFAIVTL